MLDRKEFDLWADGYDQSVGLCEEKDEYPFAGYKDVLGSIYRRVAESGPEKRILDIGFGTGTLTKKLYEAGNTIVGVDFSSRMIQIAQEKMPAARFFCQDFTKGLPVEVKEETFDYIVSTYALHHLEDEEKTEFLNGLLELLSPGGEILIGDVAFHDREEMEKLHQACREFWDEEECYFVFEELKNRVEGKLTFKPLSKCAGVFILTP